MQRLQGVEINPRIFLKVLKMNEKTEITLTLEQAFEQLHSALEATHVLEGAANDFLKEVVGAIVGGIGAFAKDGLTLNAFVGESLKAVKKDPVCKKYAKRITDYVLHETGVKETRLGFKLEDTTALHNAQTAVSTLSVATYESKETAEKKAAEKAEKAEKKQSLIDRTAKQRVLVSLNAERSKALEYIKKEENKAADKRNESEIKKARESAQLYESLIAFAEQQQ